MIASNGRQINARPVRDIYFVFNPALGANYLNDGGMFDESLLHNWGTPIRHLANAFGQILEHIWQRFLLAMS